MDMRTMGYLLIGTLSRRASAAACLFVSLLIGSSASYASEISQILTSFRRCSLDKVVYVPNEKEAEASRFGIATHRYLAGRKKLRQANGVTRFSVDDNYLGMRVLYIDVPTYEARDDNQRWRVYFDSDFETVRSRLSKALSVRFQNKPEETTQYRLGQRPTILVDASTGASFIACDKTEMGN